ncbi:MAG: VWA domain-containing protein [Oscillospiraceae bacterium]
MKGLTRKRKAFTFDDGLEEGDEIYFETDPLNPDSDGNCISDGDEKRFQTFIHKVENEDCAVTEVRVSMEGTGNLQKTTTVESIMNKDILCSDVVGLVGEPFSIETTSQFDKATLTYVIDKSKLGDTKFDNLLFLWYDEENDNFVEQDTVLDEENFTVSVETNARAAFDIAFSQIETVEHWYSRHVILLSDGDVNVTANQILQAKIAGIKIHTIGLGSGANNQKLHNCARDTGGQFFAAKTAEELDAIYRDLSKDNHFDLEGLPDEDGDGLPDEFEIDNNDREIYVK